MAEAPPHHQTRRDSGRCASSQAGTRNIPRPAPEIPGASRPRTNRLRVYRPEDAVPGRTAPAVVPAEMISLQYGQRFPLHERSGVAVFICQHVRHDFAAVIVAGVFAHPHPVTFLRDPVQRAFRKF